MKVSALELKFYLSMDKQEAESSAGLDDKKMKKRKILANRRRRSQKLEIIDKPRKLKRAKLWWQKQKG